MDLWNRPEIDNSLSGTLSPDVDSVIHRLQMSESDTIDNSESSSMWPRHFQERRAARISSELMYFVGIGNAAF